MEHYILKCVKCGNIIEDDIIDICEECDDKELEKTNMAKKIRAFKRTDSSKITHRTKKRSTKPRKEPINDVIKDRLQD